MTFDGPSGSFAFPRPLVRGGRKKCPAEGAALVIRKLAYLCGYKFNSSHVGRGRAALNDTSCRLILSSGVCVPWLGVGLRLGLAWVRDWIGSAATGEQGGALRLPERGLTSTRAGQMDLRNTYNRHPASVVVIAMLRARMVFVGRVQIKATRSTALCCTLIARSRLTTVAPNVSLRSFVVTSSRSPVI